VTDTGYIRILKVKEEKRGCLDWNAICNWKIGRGGGDALSRCGKAHGSRLPSSKAPVNQDVKPKQASAHMYVWQCVRSSQGEGKVRRDVSG